MGMCAIPFAVDIDQVKNVLGCKDRELLERIKTADKYNTYASQTVAFDHALEDLIFHYIKPADRKPASGSTEASVTGLNEDSAHVYGYALLVICDYVGTHLLPFCDGFYYGQDFEAAVDILKANGLQIDLAIMFEFKKVFDIPDIADFPAIHLYSKQDIEHIVSVIDQIDIDEDKTDIDNEDFDEVQQMLKNIRDSFKACQEQQLEMVSFAH